MNAIELARLIDESLARLDVVARRPVQGMAMHKVIATDLLHNLTERGYVIVPGAWVVWD